MPRYFFNEFSNREAIVIFSDDYLRLDAQKLIFYSIANKK